MKKYVLTESQIITLLNGLNESYNKVNNIDDFLNNAEAEVSSSMAQRANKNVDDAMKNYLGYHYQYKYTLNNSDLVELNKLSTIIFSFLYYLIKEGSIQKINIPKIGVDLEVNYKYLKENMSSELTNLKPLLSNRFKLDVELVKDYDSEDYAKIVSTDRMIEAIVERNTKKVKSITYKFLTGNQLDVFRNLISKESNLKAVSEAIGYSITPDFSGKELTFKFN